VCEADNLPPYSADVKKSRSLNSPRPHWACMACNGCAFYLTQNFVISSLVVGIFKPVCKILLGIYHGAITVVRRTIF
jgi:hypothetical protein